MDFSSAHSLRPILVIHANLKTADQLENIERLIIVIDNCGT